MKKIKTIKIDDSEKNFNRPHCIPILKGTNILGFKDDLEAHIVCEIDDSQNEQENRIFIMINENSPILHNYRYIGSKINQDAHIFEIIDNNSKDTY